MFIPSLYFYSDNVSRINNRIFLREIALGAGRLRVLGLREHETLGGG
jgi:hypothetical protein